MHSNSALLRSLLQLAKPDSASALTLPQVFLFAIVLGQLAVLKLLMLNKWRRWFHSSRVKLPFVSVSASWFLESTYLIWIFGIKLILLN